MMTSSSELRETFSVPHKKTVSGRLRLPGSKSITQRYFNLALLGRLPLTIQSPLLSEDTRYFLGALRAAGFALEEETECLRLEPGEVPRSAEIFCGNGGTMFRFLTAALTAVPGTWQLDGVERLRERPIGPLIEALRQLGAEVHCTREEGFAPLQIIGGTLRGGEATLDAGASSQFLSALLMASLVAPRPTTIRVEALTSEPYVDLTLDAVEVFGGEVFRHGDGLFHVRPSTLRGFEITVEADFSAAAYPAAAAALCGGSIEIEGVKSESRQGDRRFIDLLERMGARVEWRQNSLVVERGDLVGVEVDLSSMPDQVPTLAALAPFAAGVTRITNVPHLRIKESDRLGAMARELQRVGVPAEELNDGLVIPGIWHQKEPRRAKVEVQTYGDHRIAMSMALVGLRRPGIEILNPGVVSKSYPDFWRDLELWTAD